MNLGNSLFQARKKSGLSQEDVAQKLGISRQTVSKWETDETVPDIRQAKQLSGLYHVSLDDLISFDLELKEIEWMIENTSEEKQKEIDWTKAWGKKYPVLLTYRQEVDVKRYANPLKGMLKDLQQTYEYNDMDSFLVLKDILAGIWEEKGMSPSLM